MNNYSKFQMNLNLDQKNGTNNQNNINFSSFLTLYNEY